MASTPDLMWCDCTAHCHGGKKVARSTWYKHKRHRPQLPEFIPPQRQPEATSSRPPNIRRDAYGQDADGCQQKCQRLDHHDQGTRDGCSEGDPLEEHRPAQDFEPGDEFEVPADMGGTMNVGDDISAINPANNEASESEGEEDTSNDIDTMLDRGCQADLEVQEELGQTQTLSPALSEAGDDEDLTPPGGNLTPDQNPDIEPHDSPDVDTLRHSEIPLPPGFTSPIIDIQRSLNFIRALQDAMLDNGDLAREVIVRLRNPPQQVLEIADPNDMFSLRQFLATQHASQQTYNDIRANHNARYPDDPMLSYVQIKDRIAEWSGVAPIVHHMCRNSCVAYTGPFSELEKCPVCQEGRYDPTQLAISNGRVKQPLQKFYTLPIGPQLQALLRTPAAACNVRHRTDKTREILEQGDANGSISIESYDDIYHGHEYLRAVIRKDICDDDMILMFSMDGAQLYRDKQSDCWIYIWVILDLPPDLRYKKKHVLPGGFIPGPNNPKHMDSFLFPGFHHLAGLQKEGLQLWNAHENRVYSSYIYFLLKSADGPGSVYLSGLVGHHGAFPCRLFCGIRGRHKSGVPHYYPALLKPRDYNVTGCDHPDVNINAIKYGSVPDYQGKLRYLLESTTITQYKQRRKATGISKPSLLAGLPFGRHPPVISSLAGDSMHVPTLNLGDLLIPLWRGMFQCAPTDDVAMWDWAVLKGDVWKSHGEAVASARPYIPGSFDRPPRNIAEKVSSGYKAKEWQGYFLGLAPALLHGILPLVYWRNLCRLVYAVRILHQRHIPHDHLMRAHASLVEFHLEYEQLYVQRREDRLHFVRPCIHALLHLALEVPRLGPPALYSTWTMERTIGNLGQEIRQPSNPYANLSERGLLRSQINALHAMIPSLDKSESDFPRGSEDLGDGYILLRARDPRAREHGGIAGQVIASYLHNAMPNLGEHRPIKVARWARLRLPTGQIARSAWKENLKPIYNLRRSRCVKIMLDDQFAFAEVHFYFRRQIAHEIRALALVQLYSEPDAQLYNDSCHTVYSVTQLDQEQGLRVIDVKSICSVVAMQPHSHRLADDAERFFVWEKVGLEVALLGDAEVSLEDA